MPESRSSNTKLDSWKEIAAYLGRDVRTVIRWEKKRGLPVRRLPGGQAVFAYQHELDAWSERGAGADWESQRLVSNSPNEPTERAQEDLTVQPPDRDASKPPPVAPVTRAIHVNKWKPFIVGLCLLGLVGFITVLVVRSYSVAAVHLSGPEKLTDDGHYKFNLRTDGRALYFNEFEVSREVLLSSPTGGGPVHPINTHFSNVDLQDVSNDGQRLLVMPFKGTEPEREVWIMPSQGGAGSRVGDVQCRQARWSPDNRRIACLTGTMIILINSDGSNTRTVGPFGSVPVQLAWSPDGDRLRFALAANTEADRSPWEITVREKDDAPSLPRKLALGGNCCGDWSWTQNGKNFVYMKSNAAGNVVLATRPENSGLISWLGRESELPIKIGTVDGFAPAITGNKLYILVKGDFRGQLLKFHFPQQPPQTILHGLSAILLSFSRDGQWMTYMTLDNSLWRSRADGTDAIQLTTPPMAVQLSAWSPDGRQIAFMGKRPRKPWRIFLVGRDGGIAQEAAPGDDSQGAPTWSEDGKALAYANVDCQETQACWIRILTLATGSIEKVPDSLGYRTARWSPDGKYIAALVPKTHDLMVYEVAKQHWSTLAKSITGDNMSWSNDSRFIFADSPQGEKPVIERVRIRDGQRVTAVDLAPLRKIPGQLGFWFGLDTDNSPIVFQMLSSSEVYAMDWADR